MSLNKYDLNAFRQAKRRRALKIDFLIVVFAIVACALIAREHPPPRQGAPAFHVSKQKATPVPESTRSDALVATASR